jgi:hypothetical protein
MGLFSKIFVKTSRGPSASTKPKKKKPAKKFRNVIRRAPAGSKAPAKPRAGVMYKGAAPKRKKAAPKRKKK